MSDKEKLKPCFRCGNENPFICQVQREGEIKGWSWACFNCSCESSTYFKTKKECLQDWNRRHKEPVDSGCDCVVALSINSDNPDDYPNIIFHHKSEINSKEKFKEYRYWLNNLKELKRCTECGQDLKPFYDSVMGGE